MEEVTSSKLEIDSGKHELICPRHKAGGSKGWLIHVIDGFVIEESSVPFQVDGSEENNDPNSMEIPKQTPIIYNGATEEQDADSQDINLSINEPYIPELPTNCKLCGGPLPEERAFWGKRFCSKSCGKRYNAGHSLRARRGYGKRGGLSGRGGRGRGLSKLKLKREETKTDSLVDPATPNHSVPTSPVSDSKSPVFPFDDATSWPYTVEGLNQYDLEEDLFDGVEPLMKYARIPAVLWSAEDVVSFIRDIPGCDRYADRFLEEEIDGQALMLIKEEHLVHSMGIKLGPALKISAHLRSFKSKYGVNYFTKYLASPL